MNQVRALRAAAAVLATLPLLTGVAGCDKQPTPEATTPAAAPATPAVVAPPPPASAASE